MADNGKFKNNCILQSFSAEILKKVQTTQITAKNNKRQKV